MTTDPFRSKARSSLSSSSWWTSSSRCGALLALSLLCGTGRSWTTTTTTTSTIVRSSWSSSSFSLRASGGGGGDEFVAAVRSALRENTFVSLSLKGPVAKKRKRRRGDDDAANAAVDAANDRLRGAVRAATGRRVRVKKGERLQVVVRFHGATDVAKNWRWSNDDDDDANDEVSRGLRDLLSGVLVARLAEHDRVDWFRGDENGNEDGRRRRNGVRSGELRTTEGRWTLRRTSARRGGDDDDHVCSFVPSRDAAVAVEAEEHDRARRVPLSPRSAFLRRLGLTDESGAPRRGAASKLRQCQKFVDVVGGLVERSSLVDDENDDDTSNRTTGDHRTIRTVDMGCGRAYLTFSLHAWLTERFGDDNVDVRTVGVDARPKLVAEVEGVARDLDDDGFSGLSFVEGTIDGATSSSSRLFRDDDDDDASANVLVALHACDTATDDALWYGVRAGAEIVVAAPCCHREARRRMERRDRRRNNDDDDDDHVLRDVLRHNVYRERTAETVTDAARALLLEVAGYDVRVFEFVGGEHTAKNVMIAAVKRRRRRERTETERNDLIERARRLTQTFGIDRLALADHMGVSLSPRDETASTTTTTAAAAAAADAVAGDIPVLPPPRRRRAKTRVDA